jgi:phage baseplate assembly protein gpV
MRELVELASRVADLERRFSGVVRHGTVDQVDPAKQIVRLKFGEDKDGNPFLSPWVPYAQIAGALKVHTPPSVGQQMSTLSPSGDWMQSIALPMHWSDQNASPSQNGDENVLTYGNVRATIKDDLVQITVGGVTVNISSDGVAITGGKVTHNGKNIGSTHIHGGVVPGGGLTDVPAN